MLVNIKKMILTVTTALLAAVCAIGCGASQNSETSAEEKTYVLNEPVLELAIGETFDLEVLNLVGTPVVWSSSMSQIASVDENGLVTANSLGTAKITASFQGKTLVCTVNTSVELIPAYALKLTNVEETDGKYALRLVKGTSFDFTAELKGCEENVNITAASNEQGVSVVGLCITANAVTETAKITFTCEYEGKTYQTECSVVVEEVSV